MRPMPGQRMRLVSQTMIDKRCVKTETWNRYPALNGDIPLPSYVDPSFLDRAHTLEYYLNIDGCALNFIVSRDSSSGSICSWRPHNEASPPHYQDTVARRPCTVRG